MLAELLVGREQEYLTAVDELGRTGRLHHVDDPTATVVVSSNTELITLSEIHRPSAALGSRHGVVESFAGRVVLGNVLRYDVKVADLYKAKYYAVPQFVMPYYDNGHSRECSAEELVESCRGVRCYRVEPLVETAEPAQVVLTDWARVAQLVRRAGLADRDAVAYAPTDLTAAVVAGQHLIDIDGLLAWDLAARADRVTDMFWLSRTSDEAVEREFDALAENREATMERLREPSTSFRVVELSAAELAEV